MSKGTRKSKRSGILHCVYGINGALEILKKPKLNITTIDLQQSGRAAEQKSLSKLLHNFPEKINHLPKEIFLSKYRSKRTQGVVVYFSGKITENVPSFKNRTGNICLLITDNIEDPQNMGQIIRTCEGAGIDGIVLHLKKDSNIPDTMLQVSQGAFAHIPIYETINIRFLLEKLKDDGFWIVALENTISAKQWHEIDYSGKIAIVVGSEGHGIRSLVLKTCDFVATIPMKGKINSLNVSSSVSAILFERQRQIFEK